MWSLIPFIILFSHGIFWMLWSYLYIHKVGKGTLIEAYGNPTKELITTEPFSFTRNPMIFGYLNIILGLEILIQSISGVFIIFPIFIVSVILYQKYFEEKGLEKRFGEEYLKYRKNTPILLPRLWKKAKIT